MKSPLIIKKRLSQKSRFGHCEEFMTKQSFNFIRKIRSLRYARDDKATFETAPISYLNDGVYLLINIIRFLEAFIKNSIVIIPLDLNPGRFTRYAAAPENYFKF